MPLNIAWYICMFLWLLCGAWERSAESAPRSLRIAAGILPFVAVLLLGIAIFGGLK